MRTVLIIMRKDLLRRLRSPLSLIVFMLFPFIFSGLLALAFGGNNGQPGPPRFKMALVNQDEGLLGGFLAGAFENERMSQYFETSTVDSLSAMELIRGNEVGGAIIVPADFTRSMLANQPTELRVVKNPSQRIAPMAIGEVAGLIGSALDGLTRVMAEPIGKIRGAVSDSSTQASDIDVAEIAVMVHHTIEDVSRYGWPPAIKLVETDDLLHPEAAMADSSSTPAEEVADNDSDGFLTVFKYVLPGMGTFALIILALGFLSDIPREQSMGTLARQMTAPVSIRAIITGKLLAAVAMALLVALLMALIGAFGLKIKADLLAFLTLSVVFVFSVVGFMLFFFAFSRSEGQGATLAWIVMMIMSMLGGSFIPVSSLPDIVGVLAKGTLNYWAITGFTDLFFDDASLIEIMPSLLVCGITGFCGLLVGSWFLERRLAKGL